MRVEPGCPKCGGYVDFVGPDLPLTSVTSTTSVSCVRCGRCCREELCYPADLAFPDATPPCPALMMENGTTYCALVMAESLAGIAPILRDGLGIGKGCSYVA